MYTISLPSFEGPLDLLLRLIERAELDITTIALARLADQYLAHVRALHEPDPRALAEFVSLAARLLLIKSRALLPRPGGRDEAAALDVDAEALARQLREYQRFKQAAAILRQWQELGRRSFLRTAAETVPPAGQQVILNHNLADLIYALERRLQLRLPIDQPAAALNLAPRLTVGEVAATIRERLGRRAWFAFDDLLPAGCSRQELIVSFWAVLELLKHRAIIVEQQRMFGPLMIGRGTAAAGERAWITDETSEDVADSGVEH